MSISVGYEFERRFLVDEIWARNLCKKKLPGEIRHSGIVQAYIMIGADYEERVRIIDGKHAWRIAKYDTRLPVRRREQASKISLQEAENLIRNKLIKGFTIEKTRYYVPFGGKIWEIDVFHGKNAGLILAEVELESADEGTVLPEWVTREVTGNPVYYNKMLALNPYSFRGESTFKSGVENG